MYRRRLHHISSARQYAHYDDEHERLAVENTLEHIGFALVPSGFSGYLHALFRREIARHEKRYPYYRSCDRHDDIFDFFGFERAFAAEKRYPGKHREKHHRHCGAYAVHRSSEGNGIGAFRGIGCHDVGHRPERHVRNGINHSPPHVHESGVYHEFGTVKPGRREEHKERQRRYRQSREKDVGFHFTPRRGAFIDDNAHHRIVDGVPYAGEQHQQQHEYERQSHHVDVEVAYVTGHRGVDHSLTAGCDAEHNKFAFTDIFFLRSGARVGVDVLNGVGGGFQVIVFHLAPPCARGAYKL